MDTTYFTDFMLVLMDSISQQALSVDEVNTKPTPCMPRRAERAGKKARRHKVLSATGERDYYRCFPRFRNCASFTRSKTVSRYLTRNPKTGVGKALWWLTLTLKGAHKEAFQGALQAWFEQQ